MSEDLSGLTVVVPAYNEQEGIESTIRELRETHRELEIIVVDDGSTDATPGILAGIPDIGVIRHARNRGYGAALKTGIRAATRPCVAWYDGDGQHAPGDLGSVARPALDDEKDLVIGVRGRGSARDPERVVGKALLVWVAQVLTGEHIPDLNSGLRAFRTESLARYLHLLPDGFSASTTSTILAMKRGWRVGHVPITSRKRHGKSTVRLISDGLHTLQLIVRLVVLFDAFRVFTLLGASLILPGLVYGIVVASTRGRGFPTLAGIAIIAGLLTFFMGIIADQVAELRKERFEDHRR